jgi:hypothetical protein
MPPDGRRPMNTPITLQRNPHPLGWIEGRPIADTDHVKAPTSPSDQHAARVFLLLSTFNGAAFLHAQLDSLLTQTHDNWVLYWRDDGSTDQTPAILAEFTARVGETRCIKVDAPHQRVFPAASYMAMIRTVLPKLAAGDTIAFVDQDDFWLPAKLRRGVSALALASRERPTLYCARLRIADAGLRCLAETRISSGGCGFPAALTQNIATGCTIMLNRAAAALVARSAPPPSSMHDWWCYLLVSAAGGRVLVDDAVVALYRQHAGNVVGAQVSWLRRALAALRRGPSTFMNVLRQHVVALLAHPELMSEQARPLALAMQRALDGGLGRRIAALRTPGLRRQTWAENLIFRLWFLIG